MKEILRKSFWQGVKKTFYTALEGPAAENNELRAPADGNLNDSPTLETPSAPSTTSEQN
jgi:hypothetical protein